MTKEHRELWVKAYLAALSGYASKEDGTQKGSGIVSTKYADEFLNKYVEKFEDIA